MAALRAMRSASRPEGTRQHHKLPQCHVRSEYASPCVHSSLSPFVSIFPHSLALNVFRHLSKKMCVSRCPWPHSIVPIKRCERVAFVKAMGRGHTDVLALWQGLSVWR